MTTPALTGPAGDPLGVLRRVMQPRERPAPGERCDMCGEPIGERHGHVANIGDRRLMCTCRGCYLLFTVRGAGGLRMRAVPERYQHVADVDVTQRQWDDLAIPVDLVFVFRQSELGSPESRVVAWYPSPAGATESELDQEAWQAILAAAPGCADMADDVEALLLRRPAPDRFVALLVPIDVCYELVGMVRANWVGFSGGTEVWRRIDEFFAELATRAAPAARARQ